MKSFLKIFALLLVFSVEVKIHAQTVFSEECKILGFGQSLNCFLMNFSKEAVLRLPEVSVHLDKRATVSVKEGPVSVVDWVRGSGAIVGKRALKVETRFGSAFCEGSCVIAVDRESEKVFFHALKGNWIISGVDSQTTHYELKAGLSLPVGLVDRSGRSAWSPAFSLSKKSLHGKLNKLTSVISPEDSKTAEQAWLLGVEELSLQYQDRAARDIASHEEGLQKAKRERDRRQKEDIELRELFRRKTLLD